MRVSRHGGSLSAAGQWRGGRIPCSLGDTGSCLGPRWFPLQAALGRWGRLGRTAAWVLLGGLLANLGPALGADAGIGLKDMQSIGPVAKFEKTKTGVVLHCADQSEVQVSVLAPDVIRVRASFTRPLATVDHSWAIAETTWDPVAWSLHVEKGALRLVTTELEVVVTLDPVLIQFQDANTHRTINADQRPMAFDPQSGVVAAAKRLGIDEHFFGLGEKAAPLDRRRGLYTMWTSDTAGYTEGTDPLYQSIPFYIGWQYGAAYGIFFDNSYRTRFDLGYSSQEYAAFSADGGEMNYYFLNGPSIKKVLGRYADLTGHMPLPPLWALGNQQSRYSYYPDSIAEEVVRRYRADDLPLDVLHLDIQYMNEYRDFTWDLHRFPDPKAFVSRLKSQGVKVVTIVDPGIKYQLPAPNLEDAKDHPELAPQDKSYYVFNQGHAHDYFLKRLNGQLYVAKVWPGDSVFVDYTNDAAARWWGDLHRALTDQGVAGIWDDMNEPVDFSDRTGASQADVVSDDHGTHSLFAKNRNVFALNMARATYEGLERLLPEQRPFVISRSGYAGIQRYATMWTGDNTATWESLALSLPMLESLGLSGEPFVGTDIGGFRGRTTGELLARWYEVSFLVPLRRNHAENHAYDHEPWRFGEYYENIIRKYLKLRYRLLPYLYTTLEAAHRTGVPLLRPLLLNYQDDDNTLTVDDEFMAGEDLLAAPILRNGQTSRLVYLPKGIWFDFWTGTPCLGGRMISANAPLDTVPLFIRGGSIIPMGPEMNYVGEKPIDPIRFEIYPDADGRAATSLYEDDGVTVAYRAGTFRRTTISCRQAGNEAEINVGAPHGTFRPGSRTFEFCLRFDSMPPHQVIIDRAVLPEIAPTSKGPGWFPAGKAITIRIQDDDGPHQIKLD